MPRFPAGAVRGQLPCFHGFIKQRRLAMEIAQEPAVANFMNRDHIHGLSNPPFGSHAQVIVPAHGLNVHLLYGKSFLFQQDSVVIELNRPFQDMTHTVMPQFIPILRLAFPQARLLYFARRYADFIDAESFHELV